MPTKQTLQQKIEQKQIATQQTIRLMQLVEMPYLSLEQEILKEVDENPALEIVSDPVEDDYAQQEEAAEPEYDENGVPFEVSEPLNNDEIFNEEYYNEEEMDDFMTERTLQRLNAPEDRPRRDSVGVYQESIREQWMLQLGEMVMTDEESKIACYLMGNLDDDGYFTLDMQAVTNELLYNHNIDTTVAEVERILVQYVQELDPPGTGARNLQECLLIQLRRQSKPTEITRLAILILEQYFDLFTKKHYAKIMSLLGIHDDVMQQVLKMIRSLDPKPVDSDTDLEKSGSHITPDFIITAVDDKLTLTLNNQYIPKVRINKEIVQPLQNRKLMSRKEADAVQFLKDYVEKGELFINTLSLREKIMYNTMYAIMQHQLDYFLTGDDSQLKPMVLKTIAAEVKLDVSTISRFSNSKYVQTDFGIIPVKHLFSEAVNDDEVSSKEIKSILTQLVQHESKQKPLSDEALCAALQEKGYAVARRTVAKYRDQLNIPVARLRKEL
ncbi:MAG: RNA polymerase factor sigma-54 [Bacteroidales bacterium]|nr:RNA polymerase factor sigma-54 [Bacteroidales bacterium]